MMDDFFFNNLFGLSFKNLLDRYWLEDREKYEEELRRTKAAGFKVYRNSDGEHKVVKR